MEVKNAVLLHNGEVIGEVEQMKITVDREPTYWCPICNKGVKATVKGDSPNFAVVCDECGSTKIMGYERFLEEQEKETEFNPSRR